MHLFEQINQVKLLPINYKSWQPVFKEIGAKTC